MGPARWNHGLRQLQMGLKTKTCVVIAAEVCTLLGGKPLLSISVSISQAVKLICGNTVCEFLDQAAPGENVFVCAHPKRVCKYRWCKGLQRESGESLGYVVVPISAERDLASKSHH